ncbi:MAG: DinB family protein [Fimbriimonadaceae bacterium]|nr:DinB family protein [Fimbriimonadaceae bacterium]
MTATEVLVRLIERQQDSFLETLKKVPEDKLDWIPGEGTRSARDQAQEVATILEEFWEIYEKRAMTWDMERWTAYMTSRGQVRSIADLEARLRGISARLIEFIQGLPESELGAETQMPFPGEFLLVDNIHYHVWNMAYHQGQITTILQLLGLGGDQPEA